MKLTLSRRNVNFHYETALEAASQTQRGLELSMDVCLRAASSLLSLACQVDGHSYEEELHEGVRLMSGLAMGDYAPTVTVRVRAARLVATLHNTKTLLDTYEPPEDDPQ